MTETGKAVTDGPKMRRLPSNAVKLYGAAHLYLDDLEVIEAAFHRASKRVEVIADGYEFDSVQDLRLLNKPVVEDELGIRCWEPFGWLRVKPSDVTFYRENSDDMTLAGLMSHVGEILEKRATPSARQSIVSIVARSTDPQPLPPQKPPTWLRRNRDWVVPIVSAAVGALCLLVGEVFLALLGVLKAH
jgi:hypothetical protein